MTPPRDIWKNFLPRALLIDLAIVVFPTPGPPTRQKIFPLRVPLSFPTAII